MICPSGFKAIDAVTRGGIQTGHPWLLIDERAVKYRGRWFRGESFKGIEVLLDPTALEYKSRIKDCVLNDRHLVIVTYSNSPQLDALCSVVMRVTGGELVVTKNAFGPKARVRLPS